jgi:hypothetical protein
VGGESRRPADNAKLTQQSFEENSAIDRSRKPLKLLAEQQVFLHRDGMP